MSKGLSLWHVAKANVNEFFRVKVPMMISSCGNWSRKCFSSRVNGLPDIAAVDATRDLPDEDRRYAVGPQLLVRAQEVDFSHEDGLS